MVLHKVHVGGVITGSVNSYCLACDSFLKSPQDAVDHVKTVLHQKNRSAVQYSDKFPNERIRKFKAGYYCEACNVLLPIASKVSLHLTEEEHKLNKCMFLLKSKGDDVLAFGNILIEERAWHGLIDGVCSLCNAEFDDEKEHKSEKTHCLNLVLKAVKIGPDNTIYRHLDDSAVQCLTCNKLLAPHKMSKHFDDAEHHDLYAKCRIETNGLSNGNTESDEDFVTENEKEIKSYNENKGLKIDKENKELKKNIDRKNIKKPTAEEKSKILESIVKYQSKGININLETETVFCKKCSEVITFDQKEIENHIESHLSAKTVDSELLYPSNLDQNLNRVDINDKTTKSSNVKGTDDKNQNDEIITDQKNDAKFNEMDEAKKFAKENQLTFNEENNQSYCRICEVHLPSSFKSMKEHVAGANHKKVLTSCKSQVATSSPKLKKEKTKDFLNSAYDVEGFFYHDSIVNEDFCVPRNSFYLITENNRRLRCLICEVTLLDNDNILEAHAKSSFHCEKFLNIPVIISEKSELIREVRPGLFHCAYCNLVVSGWTLMKQHLTCSDHKEKRNLGEARLRRHLPGLQRYKFQKQMENLRMMHFFNLFRNDDDSD